MSRLLYLTVLLCCLAGSLADDAQVEEVQHESSGLSSLALPSELNLSDSFVRAVGTAGVLVTAVAGLAALLSFILPLFGFRTCALLGTCDSSYDTSAYSNAGMASNSVYDQQQFTGYQYPTNAYKKRSLEYVGPILKALSAAYDKYGPKARSLSPKPAEVVPATAK